MHVEFHLIALIHMPMGLFSSTVEVVDRVLMEGILMIAIQDVVKPWGICQSKYAMSIFKLAMMWH